MLTVQEIRRANELVGRLRARREEVDAALVERILNQALALSGRPQVAAREYLTTGQTARILGVSLQTIKNWVAAGELSGRRVGGRLMIRREDVSAYLDRLAARRSHPLPPSPSEAEAAVRQHEAIAGGLPTEQLARYEELSDRIREGQRLSDDERAELASITERLTRLATKRTGARSRRRLSPR